MDCAECQRNACGVHWRPPTAWRWWANPIHPSDPCGVQDIEEHYVVEALLGHSGSQVGSDASDGRKGPFPSCSGNRDCEIDPHQFKLSTSLNMLEASGAAASMFARVRTLVTLEAMSGQLFRRSGSTRSCLSSFLMSMSLLYKS